MTAGTTRHDTPAAYARGRGRTRRTVAAALLATLCGATAASATPPSEWTAYTALATKRLDIGSNIEVSGNYGVILPGGRLTLGTNTFHSPTQAGGALVADSMEFTTGASANDVYVNSLKLNGTSNVRGTTTTPFPFPLTVNAPTLPADTSNPCVNGAQNVTVTKAQSPRTLPAGCYRDVAVDGGATLELTGGNYIFRRLRVEPDAQAVATAPTTINVAQQVITQLRSSLYPQSGAPEHLELYVAGTNNQVGNEALFIGRFIAPNDPRLEFGVRALFVGNAYAEGINIFGVHLPRTPTPTPPPTPTPTSPFIPPTPTPTPTPTQTPPPTPPPTVTPSPTPTPVGPTPTPTPPPTPTVTFTPFVPPTATPTPGCLSPFSPGNCG
ncbi:MAG TPA: hypothetical protein VIS07_07415 [Candidatus Binatia bacterium]